MLERSIIGQIFGTSFDLLGGGQPVIIGFILVDVDCASLEEMTHEAIDGFAFPMFEEPHKGRELFVVELHPDSYRSSGAKELLALVTGQIVYVRVDDVVVYVRF